MTPTERTVLANGLRHHVLVWNDAGAPTVLLCHGFLDLAWSFEGVAEHLAAEGLRVVAFDWRGHGETEHVGAGGYYHFADYVLDLHALVPQLSGGDGLHLVGHSMGGTASALYAATHPRVPRTLTLVEGIGPPSQTPDAPDKMISWLESMDRARRGELKVMPHLAEVVRRLRAANTELPADLAYRLAERATRDAPDGEGLVWRFDPLHRTTSPSVFTGEAMRAFLVRIECPTLVVSGSRGFRPADHQERVDALLDARELEIPDVGHMIHQLAPAALAAAIVEHVRGAR